MKTEDFERLKAVCEKEGFTIESYSGGKTAIIGVKDPWEGVEFFEALDRVYKLNGSCHNYFLHTYDKSIRIDLCKPSTEQAYVEQLKKEAFEKFGEIKEGNRFIGADSKKSRVFKNPSFYYWKSTDHLNFGGVPLYIKGKWAERVKERIEVEGIHSSGWGKNSLEWEYDFEFKISDLRKDAEEMHTKVLPFLASQLEKYLNNEIE